MATTEQYLTLLKPYAAGPLASQTPDEGSTIGSKIGILESQPTSHQYDQTGDDRLFAFAKLPRLTFAERFPRLAISLVVVGLLVFTLNAEIDCLRGAGFHWN
jgi:hypothetical protein